MSKTRAKKTVKKKAIARTQPDQIPEDFATLTGRFDLQGITLVRSFAEHSIAPDERDKIDTSFAFRLKSAESKKGNARIVISFKVEGVTADSDPQETRLHIEADYLLHYTISSGPKISKDQLTAFAIINGRFNAWPYWREYVQSTTVRMGLPPLMLPLLKFKPPEKSPRSGRRGPATDPEAN